MNKFWKWAVILMTATMAAGLATSCEEKGNTEPEDMGVDISMEITEADATSGIVRLTESRWMEYRNLTKDSVTFYEDDASIVYEARTPEGWGLTVNNYVDLTPAIQ